MNIPLNIDWQQILLHLLNFAILAGGLYLLLFKPVKAFMEKRESYYQNMDSEAKQKLQDAEALKDSYTRQLDSAAQEIAQKKADAQKANEARRREPGRIPSGNMTRCSATPRRKWPTWPSPRQKSCC